MTGDLVAMTSRPDRDGRVQVVLDGTPVDLARVLREMAFTWSQPDEIPGDDLLESLPASELDAIAVVARMTVSFRRFGQALPYEVAKAIETLWVEASALRHDCPYCGASGTWCVTRTGRSSNAHSARLPLPPIEEQR